MYANVRQAESRKLAHAVQHELVAVLGNVNPAIRDKGVRSAPFLVLVATESPGILAEVSCLSNEEEAARLAEPAYRQRIARALFLGIHAYAEARNRVATLGQAQGASQMSKKTDVLHVGIDLGTSRSSISASNGARHVVESYVGWPVDMVARRLVKKPILFGREALDNRPMLDLHRPLEHGLIKEGSEKDEQAVQELLRHLISLAGARGRPAGPRGRGRARPRPCASAGRTCGTPSRGSPTRLMIVSEPFAVSYGMDALLHTMIVDIGAGTTDFCVMRGRYPTEEDQRTLTHAGDSVDEQLATLIRASTPTPGSRSTWCASGRRSGASWASRRAPSWSPSRSRQGHDRSTSRARCAARARA